MSVPQKKVIRSIALVIASIGLFVPVTVSPSQGIQGNEACADGKCCREMNSVCLQDGTSTIHHYQTDGSCSTEIQ